LLVGVFDQARYLIHNLCKHKPTPNDINTRSSGGLWPRAHRTFAGITRESPAEHLKSIDIGGFKTLFLFPFQVLDTQTWGASKGTGRQLSFAKTPHLSQSRQFTAGYLDISLHYELFSVFLRQTWKENR
jgi:hypothetical protein